MTESPDIASIAFLIGDPARSRILLALMGGRALTATELAMEAGVVPSTTSVHLARLTAGGLIHAERQGRHRYFRIADEVVADVVERLCGMAMRSEYSGKPSGPKDPDLRRARVCYDHLAGEISVRLYRRLIDRKLLTRFGEGVALTIDGERFFVHLGVDLSALQRSHRALCRPCLDWSERRHHLAGSLGAAILTTIYAHKWAQKDLVTRAVHFTASGEKEFARLFGLPDGH